VGPEYLLFTQGITVNFYPAIFDVKLERVLSPQRRERFNPEEFLKFQIDGDKCHGGDGSGG
jgi:hypothetical protein